MCTLVKRDNLEKKEPTTNAQMEDAIHPAAHYENGAGGERGHTSCCGAGEGEGEEGCYKFPTYFTDENE